jgi:hypothetical protein
MHLFFPVQAIPHAPNALIALHVMRYRGRPLVLADGTPMRRGDRVAELHLQNRLGVRLMQQGDQWKFLAALRKDFRALAEWMASDPALADVRAIWGTTILSRAAPRFGFMVRARPPTLLRWLERFFLQGLLVIFSQEGIDRLKHGKVLRQYPQEVWMSRAQLLQRYLSQTSKQPHGMSSAETDSEIKLVYRMRLPFSGGRYHEQQTNLAATRATWGAKRQRPRRAAG